MQGLYADLLTTPRESGRILSAATVRNLHRVLVLAFSVAVSWGLIDHNPATAAQGPRPRRPEMAVVDQPMAERILDASRGSALELPAAIARPEMREAGSSSTNAAGRRSGSSPVLRTRRHGVRSSVLELCSTKRV